MDLAIAADYFTLPVDEERRVEPVAVGSELRVAQIEPDAEVLRLVEERLCGRVGHLALEETVDLLLPGHPVTRKKRGQRELGKDDKLGTAAFRFTQHGEQALDDPLAGVGEVDGALGPRRD